LTGVTNALNQTTTFASSNAGLVTSTTDARGFTSTFAYDAMNRLTGQTLADTSTTASTSTFTYDGDGNRTGVTDPLNHTTSYAFDKLNRLTGVTDALNETTTYNYDAAGNRTGITNPLNQTTTLGYDAANRQTSIINALNQTTTIGYDAAGEKTSVTDPLNHTTTYSYTPLGQLASATDALGNALGYGYNAAGYNTSDSVSGPGQGTLAATMTYNAIGEVTTFTDFLGNKTQYQYDAAGNRTGVTDPLNHTTTYAYDALNRLVSITDPLNHTTTLGFDADGNPNSVTDPLNRTTTKTFDAQGRLLSVTDPLNGTTNYAYNLAGLLTSLTDPVGNQTTYGYDAVNRLTSTTDPLGHAVTYAYNAASELTGTTDRDGRTINYGYDAAGRQTSETWVGGNYTATYAYNAAGLLSSVSDPFSAYSYGYDAANRLTSVDNSGTPGAPHVVLNYSYNDFGNRTQMTDSLGGTVSYGYDAEQRLTSLQLSTGGISMTLDAQLTFGYDQANRLTGITRTGMAGSDSIQSSFGYDAANRLTNITHTDTTRSVTLANYTYGYDAASQLTSYQDANSSLTYGYDNTGQLTSAAGTLNGSSYSVSYSYDKNGNRNMTGYTTGTGNELTSDGTNNYTYDNEGNTLTQTNIATGSVTYFTWDYRNRLTEVQVKDSHGNLLNDEKFTYDVNNNRIGVSLNGTQQSRTVFDGANPYMDFNGSGTLTERYLTDPRGLSQFYGQVSASGAAQWFLTDNINSIRQVVDTSGNSLDAITYDPYGNLVSQTNSANAPRFGYAGGAVDSLTGNVQDDARYYRPADGKFLSEDPLGFKAHDTDLYRYSFNDPVSLSDPSGEILVLAIVGISIYLAGAATYKYSKWSMQNQQSSMAVSTTYARWGMAAGKITTMTGLSLTGAAVLGPVASAYPIAGYGMFGTGAGMTAWGGYNLYQADHTGWGAPEYTGEIGSLAAPWVVGGGWYAGNRWGGWGTPRLPVSGNSSSLPSAPPLPGEIPPARPIPLKPPTMVPEGDFPVLGTGVEPTPLPVGPETGGPPTPWGPTSVTPPDVDPFSNPEGWLAVINQSNPGSTLVRTPGGWSISFAPPKK
jgi:RHS repeat-associated protein